MKEPKTKGDVRSHLRERWIQRLGEALTKPMILDLEHCIRGGTSPLFKRLEIHRQTCSRTQALIQYRDKQLFVIYNTKLKAATTVWLTTEEAFIEKSETFI